MTEPPVPREKDSTALIAIVLGIGALVFAAVLPPVGIVVGIAGLLLALYANKTARIAGRREPQPLVAMALSIIGGGLSIVFTINGLIRILS